MRKVSRKSITQEYLFEAEDGTLFPYEGLAIEHDIKLLEEEISEMRAGDINIPDLNLIGSIYKINNKADLSFIEKYCELKDYDLNEISVPTNIIITDNFVISAEELRKVVEGIAGL